MTPEQKALDAKLWWTTVRPWLAQITGSWPSQPRKPRAPDQCGGACGNPGCAENKPLES